MAEAASFDQAWTKHGEKISGRMKAEGIPDNQGIGHSHQDKFRSAIQGLPSGEHEAWTAKAYAHGAINKFEDIQSRAVPALNAFHQAKKSKKLPEGTNPDINSFKTFDHLESTVEKIPKEESKVKVENSEYTRTENEHWIHVVPHTEEASKKYGANTRWCTAADKHCLFNSYNKTGELHIFIPKKPKYAGEKYQLHGNSESFMNEKDERAPKTARNSPFKDRPITGLYDLPEKEGSRSLKFHMKFASAEQTKPYADHWHHDLRAAAASHPDNAAKLVNDPYDTVREHVAKNTTNTAHLEQLAHDPYENVQAAVIARKHDPATAIVAGKTQHAYIKHQILQQNNLAHAEILQHDSDPAVATKAKRKLATTDASMAIDNYDGSSTLTKDQATKLAKDPATNVKTARYLTSNYSGLRYPSVIQHFANHPDPETRFNVVSNYRVPPKVAAPLAKDPDPVVAAKATVHGASYLPVDHAAELLRGEPLMKTNNKYDREESKRLGHNPDSTTNIHSAIMQGRPDIKPLTRHADPQVRRNAVGNLHTSGYGKEYNDHRSEALHALYDPDVATAKRAVASVIKGIGVNQYSDYFKSNNQRGEVLPHLETLMKFASTSQEREKIKGYAARD